MARTTKNIIGDGYTTYGDDGVTYHTSKNVLNDNYTTVGSDGSTYRTNRNAIGKGYTTYQTSGPTTAGAAGGGLGGTLGLFGMALLMALCSVQVLSPLSYALAALVVICPFLSGVCESRNISRIWCSGALFCFSACMLIYSVFSDARAVFGTKHGPDALMTILGLVMLLLLAFMFAIFGLGESGEAYCAYAVMFICLPWCFFDGIASGSNAPAIGVTASMIEVVIAIIQQDKMNRAARAR